MTKREIILDFTSLLDVIMIILFLLVCNMNDATTKGNAEIDELTGTVTILQEDLDNLKDELAKAEESLAVVKAELDDKTAELEKVDAERIQYKIKIEELTEEIDKLKEDKKVAEAKLENALATAQTNKDALDKANEEIKNQQAAIDKLNQDIEKLNQSIDEKEQEVAENLHNAMAAQDKLKETEEALGTYRTMYEASEAEILALKEKYSDYADIYKQVDELKQKNQELGQTTANLTVKVADAKEEARNARLELEKVQEELSKAEGLNKMYSDRDLAQQQEINSLNQQIEDLKKGNTDSYGSGAYFKVLNDVTNLFFKVSMVDENSNKVAVYMDDNENLIGSFVYENAATPPDNATVSQLIEMKKIEVDKISEQLYNVLVNVGTDGMKGVQCTIVYKDISSTDILEKAVKETVTKWRNVECVGEQSVITLSFE